MVSIWSLGSLRSLQSLHWWFPLTFCDRWRSFTIATIAEIDSDSIPAIVIVAIIGSRWDRWRSLALAKINTSLHCSKFAVVHHVVYSLWVGWCLFKSGTLPLTLQKFIKIVYFSNFLTIPTAGENPLLMTLRTKLKYMVPTWLKKFLNGPASFWDLFSSCLAQSSYLVRNRDIQI